LRATYDDVSNTPLTPGLFFMPYAEINQLDGAFYRPFELPLFFGAGTDVKMFCIPAQTSTVCSATIRGWIE
jgi:hypothetical protein